MIFSNLSRSLILAAMLMASASPSVCSLPVDPDPLDPHFDIPEHWHQTLSQVGPNFKKTKADLDSRLRLLDLHIHQNNKKMNRDQWVQHHNRRVEMHDLIDVATQAVKDEHEKLQESKKFKKHRRGESELEDTATSTPVDLRL